MTPGEILKLRSALLEWYRQNKRDLPWRSTGDPYKIWLSEVMLQQTQVKTAIPYYHRFLAAFPDLKTLAAADLQQVHKLWEGLGYYARARNFQKAAQIVTSEFDGKIPLDYPKFRELPGVGEYIAAAVLSIVNSAPLAVVDGNVKRALSRLFMLPNPVNEAKSLKIFQRYANLIFEPNHPADFNQAIMELGALVCAPKNAKCDVCPISVHCLARQNGEVENFPRKNSRRKNPQINRMVVIVESGGKYLVRRRKLNGLLGGLWQFPDWELNRKIPDILRVENLARESFGLILRDIVFAGEVKHAYTHFNEKLFIFTCKSRSASANFPLEENYLWASQGDLENIPLIGSNHKILKQLGFRKND